MISWSTIQTAILSWVRTSSGFSNENVFWSQDKRPFPGTPYINMRISVATKRGLDWVTSEHNPLVIPDDIIEVVDDVDNTLTLTNHGLQTADGPVRFVSSGTLPGGIVALTDYWIIRISANEISLASTFHNAYDLIGIDITSPGSGVITLQDTDETVRYGEEIKRSHQGTRDCRLTLECVGGTPKGVGMPIAVLEHVLSSTELDSVITGLSAAGVGIISSEPISSNDGYIGSTLYEPRAQLRIRIFVPSEVVEYSTFVDSVELTNQVTNDVTEIVLPEE